MSETSDSCLKDSAFNFFTLILVASYSLCFTSEHQGRVLADICVRKKLTRIDYSMAELSPEKWRRYRDNRYV